MIGDVHLSGPQTLYRRLVFVMQFYARFQDEVIAAPELIAAHVARARAHVSDAFRHIFDEALVEAHEQLVAEPANLAARFVAAYHLILEATLGLTTLEVHDRPHEIRAFALAGLTRRLDIVGVPLSTL